MTGYTAFVLMYNSMYIIVVIIINITTTATTNIIVIIIYPLTARVVVAPPMISQPISSIFFSVLHCPLGLAELQACPLPNVVFPLLPLSALSSSPFHLPRTMVLARPNERET